MNKHGYYALVTGRNPGCAPNRWTTRVYTAGDDAFEAGARLLEYMRGLQPHRWWDVDVMRTCDPEQAS